MKINDVDVSCIACMGFGSPTFGTVYSGDQVIAKYGVARPFINNGYLRLSAESADKIKSMLDASKKAAR